MEFEKRKAVTLASLGSTETDKSPKGTLDIPILPLLKTLNLHPSYFTTSSCSGRISILSQPISTPTTTTAPTNRKAKGGTWLFITHDPADPTSVLNLLFSSPTTTTESTHPEFTQSESQAGATRPESTRSESTPFELTKLHELVFRFEPLIIAVECKDVSSAQSLVSMAISSGFRESGITSAQKRVIIAIRCSIRLEVPLGDTNSIRVSREYVEYLVGIANAKMEANRKRTDGFLRALLSSGFSGQENVINVGGKKDCLLDSDDCIDSLDGETYSARSVGHEGNRRFI